MEHYKLDSLDERCHIEHNSIDNTSDEQKHDEGHYKARVISGPLIPDLLESLSVLV